MYGIRTPKQTVLTFRWCV